MKTEEECESNERYLFADELLSDDAIFYLKKEVEKRFKNKGKPDLYDNFMNWKRKNNEIMLFTLYAYSDLTIPKTFDCQFNLGNPSEYSECILTLTQSLYEGWVPSSSLDDGHKHLCVFEFEDNIPEIINNIHVSYGAKSNIPINHYKLGICNSKDFNSIRSKLENKIYLKINMEMNGGNMKIRVLNSCK